MREIIIVFICIVGFMVISFWALAVMLAVKSGKGIIGILSRSHKMQWLSPSDTIAQYGNDDMSADSRKP